MIRTYSMNLPCARDHIKHRCECGRVATHWTQDEGPGWAALGPVVYHCKAHKEMARQKAGERKLSNDQTIQVA